MFSDSWRHCKAGSCSRSGLSKVSKPQPPPQPTARPRTAITYSIKLSCVVVVQGQQPLQSRLNNMNHKPKPLPKLSSTGALARS